MKLQRSLSCLIMGITLTMAWLTFFTYPAYAQNRTATHPDTPCQYASCNYQDPVATGCARIGQVVPYFTNEDRSFTTYWAGSQCQTNWAFVNAHGLDISSVMLILGAPGIGAYYCNTHPSSPSCTTLAAIYCEAWLKQQNPAFCSGPPNEPANVRDATMVDFANWQTDMLYILPSQPFRVCADFAQAPNDYHQHYDACSAYH